MLRQNRTASPHTRSSRAAGRRVSALAVLLVMLFSLLANAAPLLDLAAMPVPRAEAADGDLTITINAGWNLVVDSNVSSPSTYAPRVATVIGKFCNTGDAALTNVYGYIGNGTVPGAYPVYDSDTQTTYPYLNGTGDYFFRHVGAASDASRYIGTIPAGECRYQYWTFEYPACENVGGVWKEPPCTGDPTWGTSVKPDDDLALDFVIWGTAAEDLTGESATWTMTMRNEISAMANKIEPNGNPPGHWFNLEEDNVQVGDIITTNGILYSLGNVGAGFDNDGDYVPDRNAWVQPISQADFDPTCFRLIRTSGILTITTGGGAPTILPFEESLYFTQLPPDNTGVRGEVYYTFLALNGPCNTTLTPYQEVASGYDNEKFNGDYGAGLPIGSLPPEVAIEKSGSPSTVLPGDPSGNVLYTIPFENNGDRPAGLTLASGQGVNMPLVIRDTVPAGMWYLGGSAASGNTDPTDCSSNCYTIRYSVNGGASWSLTDPGDTLSTSGSPVMLEWWLNNPLPVEGSGAVTFRTRVPTGYGGTPFIENTACIGLGNAPSFACDTALTLVQGNNSIGDRVWKDDAATNGVQDTGETGITGVPVSLYWDKNGDGELDDGDILITSQPTGANGAYSFPNLPDGNYIVVVDSDDADIPTGYTNTTAGVLAVPLDPTGASATAVNVTWADFGFGPVLTLEKALTSANPAYEGELVTFDLDLTNNLPGDGSGEEQACTYTAWDTTLVPATEGYSGSGNKAWGNPANIALAGEPEGSEAYAPYANAAERIAVKGFSMGTPAGTPVIVELLVDLRWVNGSTPYTNETLGFSVIDCGANGTCEGSNQGEPNGDDTWIVAEGIFSPRVTSLPTDGLYPIDVSSYRNWTWADFNSSRIAVRLETGGSGPNVGEVYVDAVAFRATSDLVCGGRDSTITLLPLADRYDASKLQFVSASIAPDSVTTGGSTPYANTGTLSWDNVGPLAAGQTRTIQVTFLALEPPGNAQTTTINYANVSDAEFGNGRPVNDAADEDDVTINPTGSIGDTIWNDNGAGGGTSGDGTQNGGEAGIPGVTVYLDLWNGSTWVLQDTQVTDADGKYLFDGLRDGLYRVRVNTASLPGTTFTQTGDPDATLDNQTQVTISGANDVDTADFGYLVPNTIYGNVWHDWDGEGDPDSGDDGISGVTVRLYDNNNQLVATTTTDADGNYVFSDLLDGTYHVVVDNNTAPLGSDWSNTADPEGTPGNNQSDPIAVFGGNLYGSYDFGYYQTGDYSLSGNVYADWNDNADFDGLDAGFGGIPVTLYSSTGAVIATTTTLPDGSYSFDDLPSGSYTVVVDESVLPDQYSQTENYGEPGFCVVCGGQASVTIAAASVTGVDFGYEPDGYGSIGDTVWRDDNGNGLQGTAEPGLDGITVWLEVDYGDGNGYQRVAETTTAGGGQYLFPDLPPGDYRVVVNTADTDLPDDGYGNPYVPSTPSFFDVELDAGETHLEADFGFAPGAIIGNRIWRDDNGNGNQDEGEPGLDGVIVGLYTWTDVNGNGIYDASVDTLSDDPLATDTTEVGGDGLYLFTGLPAGNYVVLVESGIPGDFAQSGDPDWLEPCTGTGLCDGASGTSLSAGQVDLSRDFGYTPPGVIGDYIWFDVDGDGVQDDNEQGIGYVTVRLCSDVNCNTVLGTTQTDSDGYYSFGDLDAGTYYVQVDSNSLPAGLTPTYDKDGTGTPHVAAVTLLSGGSDLTVDFGYRYAGDYDISGTVFFDAEDNGGLYNGTTDTPFEGITVYLWQGGVLIGTTTTNASGYYEFSNLPDGAYVVSVDRNSPELVGMDQNTPQPAPYYRPVTIEGADKPYQDFGYHAAIDYGDLPDTSIGAQYMYPTVSADQGAGHIIGGPQLGDNITPEVNGQPDDEALGDVGDDGIVFSGQPWSPGTSVDLTANVVGLNGYLVGWFDWDGDGSFGTDEMMILGDVSNGANPLTIDIPDDADTDSGYVYMRFRLYDSTTMTYVAPTGLARGGEVEDYRHEWGPTAVKLLSFTATARANRIGVAWETASEDSNAGFNLYRRELGTDAYTQLNGALIPSKAPGQGQGASYSWVDGSVTPGVTYEYLLEDVDMGGARTQHGPAAATARFAAFYPLIVK